MMSANTTITLGVREFHVEPIPLGRLKKLMPTFNRVGIALELGQWTEEVMTDVINILSLGMNIPAAELEELPATAEQLTEAIEVVGRVAGLVKKGDGLGESTGSGQPTDSSTPGTSSTPVSSPPPAGPGSTSTST